MAEWFWPDSTIGRILMIASVVIVFLPPKYDPAIRLKEWVISRKRK